jgi:hypothetical protein
MACSCLTARLLNRLHVPRFVTTAGTVCLLAGNGLAPAAPSAPPPRSAEHPATQQSNQLRQGNDALSLFRSPLIREGSYLMHAPSRLIYDEARGEWKLIVDATADQATPRELIVLPCTRLAEMQQFIESSGGGTAGQVVKFQVTGRVTVFRNRNYVLPTHAPVLTEPQGVAERQDGPHSAGSATQPEQARDIAAELERAAGPLPRVAVPPALDNASSSSPAGGVPKDVRDRLPTPAPGQAPGIGRGEVTATQRSAPTHGEHARPLAPENSFIASRRGKLTRDGGGGWVFVFDADASGLADPPLRVMPCLLLERIEDYARRAGNNSPALLSGTVYTYRGQNYLLPTAFRIPQDGGNLSP